MKITVAKSAGFCFGVKHALKVAFQAVKTKQTVYMLGDLVHNENVMEELTKAVIKKVRRLTKVDNKILLIRAHGTPTKTYGKAKKLGYNIVDATCPMVKEIHTIRKSLFQLHYTLTTEVI